MSTAGMVCTGKATMQNSQKEERMIQNIWWKVLEMGLAAGWLVLVILILRLVCKRFLPHNIRCLLWLLVAVRLVCPVMPESVLSLMPRWESRTAGAERESRSLADSPIEGGPEEGGIPETKEEGGENDKTQSPAAAGLPENIPDAQASGATEDTGSLILYLRQSGGNVFAGLADWLRQFLPDWTGFVWLAGTVLAAGYGFYGYGRMHYLVRDAVPEGSGLQDDSIEAGKSGVIGRSVRGRQRQVQIWRSDRIQVPFILGVIRPRIYLPCGLRGEARECVVAHEQMHMRRYDPLVKLAAYLLLAVYWFQPLLWLAYVLLGRDIELACDEKVIRGYGADTRRKRSYMDALLTVSTQGAIYAEGVLGFGEPHVKGRISNLLHYKRPAVWTVGIGLLLCALAAVGLLTNPRQENEPEDGTGTDWLEISGWEETNIIALPMENMVKVDLDGDGQKELVQITVTNKGESAQLNGGDWYFAQPVITVDGQEFVPQEQFFENLDLCTWYLLRLGGELQGWQIGLYEDGPSADPRTCLYAYAGEGQFTFLGSFYDCAIEDQEIWPGYRWNRGGEEPVSIDGRSYQEVLAQVDRNVGTWMQVPGDGSLYARQNMDILQTEKVIGHFQFSGKDGTGFQFAEQESYDFWNGDESYQQESAHRTLEEIYVYAEPDTGAERVRIAANQAVVFLNYNAETQWIEFGYRQGEARGYILADAPYSSILLAPGADHNDGAAPISRRPGEIFSGLVLVP